MLEVDTVQDAHGPRRQKVARDHTHRGVGHGRIGQALRKRGFDLKAQLPSSLLRAVQRHGVGDANAMAEARDMALGRKLLGHLRPKAMHQHQLDAHGMQDGQILHKSIELARCNQLPGHGHDKRLAVVRVDVGRHRAKPGHEGVGENKAHRGGDCAAVNALGGPNLMCGQVPI